MKSAQLTEVPSRAAAVLRTYEKVRKQTEVLCEPLAIEDYVVQSMTDTSPVKWHLAHTTWFFETFVLRPFLSGYRVFDDRLPYLFNSYYVQAGERFSRPDRGMLTRPTVETIRRYRNHVDRAMEQLLLEAATADHDRIGSTLEIGLNHEQQHQELMLTDLKHLFSLNPLFPAYRLDPPAAAPDAAPISWIGFDEGVREVGYQGEGFHFDNEGPRHRVFVEPFELADRIVTNGEYLDFMEDGGYSNPVLWLSEGFALAESGGLKAPLYWRRIDNAWFEYTLAGLVPLDPGAPLCHVSFFEADAFARWADARLPTEHEWETAAATAGHAEGGFVENGRLHPLPASTEPGLKALLGDVWEWTLSSYSPYPGYKPQSGALGEYNGKFMVNQYVLRGGSCATPRDHIRSTYRNFFPSYARWQFTGIRLARTSS